MACRDDSNRSLCAYRLLAMSDHPPPRPKMPSLPPPRPPSTKPAANVAAPPLTPTVPAEPPTPNVAVAPPTANVPVAPATRSTGSSEIPPPIVFPDSATPPLGIPRVKSFESHPLNAIRDLVPSWQQWRLAAVCVLSAAAVGFAVGRSSAPTASRASSATSHDPSCPDPTPHPTNVTAIAPPRAVEKVPTTEVPTSPVEVQSPPPATSAAPDLADQLATEKAIARAMGRGSRRAATCRGAGSPAGVAHMTVTFLPSGEVKTATVRGAPFAGTADGECIVSKFRPLRVPPFAGENVTVKKDLTLE